MSPARSGAESSTLQDVLKQISPLWGIAVGFCVVLFTFFVETLAYTNAPFDGPSTCVDVPTACWDAFAKTNGIKCPEMFKDTVIRGQLIPQGQRTCYKSIYFNVDSGTFYVMAWLVAWVTILMKAYERLVYCLLHSNVRWGAAVAMLVGQVPLWYGFVLMMHYTNDYWFNFYSSQMFFTLTESVVFISMTVLLDKRALIPPSIWYLATGTSFYHILQLTVDEGINMIGQGGLRRLGRSAHLLGGDVICVAVLWSVQKEVLAKQQSPSIRGSPRLASHRQKLAWVCAVVVIEWVVFNRFFADGASGRLPSAEEIKWTKAL